MKNHAAIHSVFGLRRRKPRAPSTSTGIFIVVALAHEFDVSAALLLCPAVDLSNPARDLRDPAERLLHPAAVLRPAAIGSVLRVSRLIGLVSLQFVKRF